MLLIKDSFLVKKIIEKFSSKKRFFLRLKKLKNLFIEQSILLKKI
jgi:hypothetical protein